jgi:hypothetical protein
MRSLKIDGVARAPTKNFKMIAVRRLLDVLVAFVPLCVAIGLVSYFCVKSYWFASFPSIFFGLLSVAHLVANRCGFAALPWSGRTTPWKQEVFRNLYMLTYCVVGWVVTTVAILAVRLLDVYPSASDTLNACFMTLVIATVGVMMVTGQRVSEVYLMPLFTNQLTAAKGDEKKELDDVWDALNDGGGNDGSGDSGSSRLLSSSSAGSDSALNEMKKTVLRSRDQKSVTACHCMLLASVCATYGLFIFFNGMPNQFNVFEAPTFSHTCINGTTIQTAPYIDAVSESYCSYPYCTNPSDYVVSPALSDGLSLRTFRGHVRIAATSHMVSPPAGCAEYRVVQMCDGLGYEGFIGSVYIGAACLCLSPTGSGSVCNKRSTAPVVSPFSWATVAQWFAIYSLWCAMQWNEFQTLRWTVLRQRVVGLVRRDEAPKSQSHTLGSTDTGITPPAETFGAASV